MRAGYFDGLSLAERVVQGSIPEPNSGCWLWNRGGTSDGYGKTHYAGRGILAHRASWIAFKGSVPAGLHVLHRCDTRCCVNPDHLFVGTNSDNVADMVAKGRQWTPKGSRNPYAKLTEESIPLIRASGETGKTLAARFGVSVRTIRGIRCGRERWKHVRAAAEATLAGLVIGVSLALAMSREAAAGPRFPDGPMSCEQAQHAAASARRDVPRHYLAEAVEMVCSGRQEIIVVTISGQIMDTISPGIRLAGLASPPGMGSVEQDTCVVFITNRADRWALLAHESAHCSGWRHDVPVTAQVRP